MKARKTARKKGIAAGFDPLAVAAEMKGGSTTTKDSANAEGEDKYVPKSVNLRTSDWRLLRLVARSRADRDGGRDSVSKVLESLVDGSRKELQKEIVQ